MKQPIKYALILFLITSICVGILGAVNQITAPIIEENNKKAEQLAMKHLMPEGEAFEEVEEITSEIVEKVYKGKKDNAIIGYIVKVMPTGYVGTITMLVGVDLEGKVSGIDILAQAESPGFGANATKDSFKEQFKGKTVPLTVSKSAKGAQEIQAITGATITSTAVTEGVNAACSYILEHKGEWGSENE